MWFTDATIAFVKELLSNIDNLDMENDELEKKLFYYDRKLNQCKMAVENLSEDFCKSMYVGIKPDEDMQKPVLLDEAIAILTNKVDDLEEQLKYCKKHKEIVVDLLNKLTKDYYPGILDELGD